ncbi:MAG: GH92 family glycosyl hydrolase [Alloprevotella sp.]|nr:GH92 family glycosyl hydrolase [Alloprevotella sp.]
MKKILLSLCGLLMCTALSAQTDFAAYVNPLVGTESSFELSTGNTYPAIATPWGMNAWVAQTGPNGDGWQYTYGAKKIRGFKQTHQPSPWINDYGVFSLMPVVGAPLYKEDARASWFSHKAEEARPYYYRVYLADYDVTAEVAPTSRAAILRFSFPNTSDAFVVLDAFDRGSCVEIQPEKNRIVGYSTRNSGGVTDNFKNYFIAEFDRPFSYIATSDGDTLVAGQPKILSDHALAVVGFTTGRETPVIVRTASSFISETQAERNLQEVKGQSFEAIKEQGHKAWNDVLGRIEVTGGTTDQLRTFYSCLYRSLLFPRSFYEFDENGEPQHYSPHDGKIHKGYFYTDTGFWDTFRCLFPLLNLVYPDESLKMQEGLLHVYEESGFFPEWASPGHRGCMVGNNSASVLTDAYIKGVRVSRPELLYEGLIASANHVHPDVSSTGRLGFEEYNRLGYVPCDIDIRESAARTLEYCYDDWCILQMAKSLKKSKNDIKILEQRTQNYRNLFDATSGLMRGKQADGKFEAPYSPYKWGGVFTEGNAWHYTWSVFHDVKGLMDLMGGREAFANKMDSVFTLPPVFDDSYYGQVIHEIREMQIMNMGQYAHGNQPIQHFIYLYDWAGQPWKAQLRLREVMDKLYTPNPDGYCGDEDNGQTSAWYVFSALGFYPVCPGTTQYALGAPLFQHAVIHLPNGKNVEIAAPNNSQQNFYVDTLRLNGKSYDKNYLEHFDLLKGVKLDFEMTDKPNLQRGTSLKAMPYSVTK